MFFFVFTQLSSQGVGKFDKKVMKNSLVPSIRDEVTQDLQYILVLFCSVKPSRITKMNRTNIISKITSDCLARGNRFTESLLRQ